MNLTEEPAPSLSPTEGGCAFDYRWLFETHPQPAWIFDRRTFQILSVNQAATVQYGFTRDELLAMSVLELHPEEERPDVIADHATYSLAGDKLITAGYWHHRKKDGTRVDVELFHARTTFEGVDAEAVVASDVTARRRAERHLAIQHEIASVFAECRTVDDAAGRILGAICRSLGWQHGALWQVDQTKDLMRNVAIWGLHSAAMTAFEAETRRMAMARGTGLAGRVWRDAAPLWIPEIAVDPYLSRRALAVRAGLHSAFGIPIVIQGKVLGVMEFASRSVQAPDPTLMQTILTLGVQVGHYLERAQAEQDLRDSGKRYRRIIETAAEGIWMLDTDLQTTFVNRHMAEMIGRSADEIIGSDAREHLFPEDLQDVGRRFQSLSEGRNEVFDRRIRRVDGTTLWASISATAILDDHNRFIGALGMLTDITERKRAEDALRASEEFNKRIVESTGDGILVLDLAGNFLYLSVAARRLLELDDDADLQGHSWLDFWETGARRTLQDAVALAAESGRASFEGTCTTPRGVPRRLEVGLSAIRDLSGSVERLAAVVRDVTERMQLQMQLAQAQKLESIGQLAAGVAHEINTPIQYVGDNARFLQDAFAELKPILELGFLAPDHKADAVYLCEEIPKALDQLLEGVEHVGRIVRAMKEFSHPGPIEKTAVDLNRAIQSTIVVSRNEWKYVAEVVEDFDASLPPVHCVGGEINQAMLNLVVNAAHAIAGRSASNQSGNSAEKGVITVSTRHDGDWAEIRVRDTGTGIPEAIRGKVFDPFFTTKEVGKGTGQGLSIAHAAIVKNHGGTIGFETETGVGTTFVVRLPVAGA